MVLVVIYHVIYIYNGVETAGVIGPFAQVQYQDAFQYLVYPWFMLLLFTVSGMCARFYLENHTDRDFLKSRTRKLLVPSTVGLLVFQWILGYYNLSISGALESLSATVPKPVFYLIMAFSGTGVLWYIQLLWVFSLALILIRKMEKDRLYNLGGKTNIIVLLLMTATIYGAAQVLNTPLIVVYRFGIYGLGFLIGYFCLSHENVMEGLAKYRFYLLLSAVILGISFLALYWGEPYAEHVVLDTLLCNVFAWITVLAVLSCMYCWGNFENPFTVWMKKTSWGLYVFHYLPLAVCAWYLHLYTPDMPATLCYLLTGIAAFVGAFVLNEIISRIPVIRWCVLGLSRKKKEKQVIGNYVQG